MGARGYQSAAAMSVVSVNPIARKKPPKELNRKERMLWREIMDSHASDYFRIADVPLLSNYCRLSYRCDVLSEQLAREGYQIETEKGLIPNPAEQQMQRAISSMVSLATKLRLCPSTRMRADNKKLQDNVDTAKPWQRKSA